MQQQQQQKPCNSKEKKDHLSISSSCPACIPCAPQNHLLCTLKYIDQLVSKSCGAEMI